MLPWKPRFESDPDLFWVCDLLPEPTESVSDAMDMCVDGYPTDFAPGKVHDQVSHFWTYTG